MPNPRGINSKNGSKKQQTAGAANASSNSASNTNNNTTEKSSNNTEKLNPETNSNSNSTTNFQPVKPDPLNFETMPLETLRKYKQYHKLSCPSAASWSGYLLNSTVGRKTHSFKSSGRVSKQELASSVKKHFMSQNVRESDTIVEFIYSVKHQDEAFKLQFAQNQ